VKCCRHREEPPNVLLRDFSLLLCRSSTTRINLPMLLGCRVTVSTRLSTEPVTLRVIQTWRLCKFFGLSEGYFLRLQNAYDTLEAKRRIGGQLTKIRPYKRDKAA